MHSPSPDDPSAERGSVTAEFVVALPAALVVIVTVLAGVQLGAVGLALHDATAVASRSVARGDSVATATARVAEVMPGAVVSFEKPDDLVCASAVARGSGLLAQVPVSARSCALAGPPP